MEIFFYLFIVIYVILYLRANFNRTIREQEAKKREIESKTKKDKADKEREERQKITGYDNNLNFVFYERNKFIFEQDDMSYNCLKWRCYKVLNNQYDYDKPLLCQMMSGNDELGLKANQTKELFILFPAYDKVFISPTKFLNEVNLIKKISDLRKRIIQYETDLKNKAKRYADEYFWDEYYEKYSIDIDDVSDGYEFEEFIARLFLAKGYKTQLTPKGSDQGVDIVLTDNFGIRIAVQTKFYTNKVGNSSVMQVVGGMKVYKCKKAIVVTNSNFSKNAREIAKHNNVILIEAENFNDFFDTEYQSDVPIFDSYSFSNIQKKIEKESEHSRFKLEEEFLKEEKFYDTIIKYKDELRVLKQNLEKDSGITIHPQLIKNKK